MTAVIVPSQLAAGIIVVKVNDLGNLATQMEIAGIEQLERFEQFGSLPNLEVAISEPG
jgi:hypothetical protein